MKRLAVLTSHPIFYQTPLWQRLAKVTDLTVFFEKDMSIRPHYDPEFGQVIAWDLPLVDGYCHVFLKSVPDLVERIWRGKFDAVLIHGWNSPRSWLAVLTAKLCSTRILLHAESPWNQELLKPVWKRAIKGFLLHILFAAADAFLYIGEENKRFYKAYGVSDRKLFFTPYAVDNDRFFTVAERLRTSRDALRKELNLPAAALVLLSVGKLTPKKRHLDLIRAYGRLSGNKALVLVGTGELRPDIEQYLAAANVPNVVLAGFVGQTKIAKYYAAADIFVLPSGLGETWGLVLNEAMCFGLPVLASNVVGAAADLVREGRNGWTFRMGDTDDLGRKLQKLAGEPELRGQFGEESRRVILEYSLEKDAEGVLRSIA